MRARRLALIAEETEGPDSPHLAYDRGLSQRSRMFSWNALNASVVAMDCRRPRSRLRMDEAHASSSWNVGSEVLTAWRAGSSS